MMTERRGHPLAAGLLDALTIEPEELVHGAATGTRRVNFGVRINMATEEIKELLAAVFDQLGWPTYMKRRGFTEAEIYFARPNDKPPGHVLVTNGSPLVGLVWLTIRYDPHIPTLIKRRLVELRRSASETALNPNPAREPVLA